MSPHRSRPPLPLLAPAALLGMALVLAACATTREVRGVKPSGFLGDYSQLREGEGDEAQLIYINPDANWKRYGAILLDSVTIWHDAETAEIPAEDQQKLTDDLYAALHQKLGQDYRIVSHPGPGVMRVRAAITAAKGARVAGNTITTIVPQMRLLSTLTGMASNTQVFAGKAAVEAEITDSLTGTRLAAGVDERAGGKTLRGLGGKWKDVENAFDFWAERLRKRLEKLRAEG